MKNFFKITVVSLLTATSFVLSYGATHQTSSGIFPPSPGQNKTTYIDNHSSNAVSWSYYITYGNCGVNPTKGNVYQNQNFSIATSCAFTAQGNFIISDSANHSALVRSGYHSCAVLENYGLNITASFSSQNCVISLA